jgi:hypothetical protein
MDVWTYLDTLLRSAGERLAEAPRSVETGAVATFATVLGVLTFVRRARVRKNAQRQSYEWSRAHEERLLLQALRDRPIAMSASELNPDIQEDIVDRAKSQVGEVSRVSTLLEILNAGETGPRESLPAEALPHADGSRPAKTAKQRLSIVRRT